jgi:hypothetical protein
VIGAGMIPLAVIGSVIIGVILILFVSKKFMSTPYILIVDCNDAKAEESALGLIAEKSDKHIVKSKTCGPNGIELTTEIRIKEGNTGFVNEISALDGVSEATLVTYNGDYMS